MTGTKHVYVKNHIPVVLLETLRGLGMKGQIVHVKRGYARHQLIPKGRAVLGTWEILEELSAEHELDLLPANLDVPEDGFSDVGEHEISVRVAFRSPEMAAGRYTIPAQLVS